MYDASRVKYIFLLFFVSILAIADEESVVKHFDPIEVSPDLTLTKLVDLTLQKYPDQTLQKALIEEAEALKQRGSSWLGAAPSFSFLYIDDLPGDNTGLREIEGEFKLPLWSWGQRDAGLLLAEQAGVAADRQQAALRLEVAGMVRRTLWDLALKNIRYQQSKTILDISGKLLEKIKRRVELGDLPRFDLLLAQSDHLEKRSLLIQAEAEMIHARERYFSLTQDNKLPVNYKEKQSRLDSVDKHPALLMMNALIEREKANLEWVKSEGSGQPVITLGAKSERGSRADEDIESMMLGFSIPFGGDDHLAPDIAAANLELTKIIARRGHLHRKLEHELHEAQHELEINRAELEMATKLKQIADKHLKMAQASFAAGEMNLLDLLKIQARAHTAIRHAKEHEVMLQHNIARYNQVVGVQP